ncbi:hypothetical protein O4H66_27420 [Comamonadaceae bacterium G21597-S1]|nr:hypothetical protein [Comamonadaceae bacterium G21597-S1]
MESSNTPARPSRDLAGVNTVELSVGQLVGEVYAAAPPQERSRLLEFLLRPLGVLALVAIADGIFAKIRFRSGWPDPHVTLEDANRVQPSDIVALVERVQQASTDAVDGLASVVAASPLMASSAAAAVLVALLVQHQRKRRVQAATLADPDFDPPG